MEKNNNSYLYTLNERGSYLTTRSRGLAPINLSKLLKGKKEFKVLDTETIGDIKRGEKAFPYDVSFISLKGGKIISQRSLINKDIFDNKYLMESAFYKNKIPFYIEKLKTDERYTKVSEKELLLSLNEYIKTHKVRYFLAYNVKFDWHSVNNLYDKVGVHNEFKKLYAIDIWKIVGDIFKRCPKLYKSYMIFCYKNNLITESGKNVMSGAESINRFVNHDMAFIENHTGLEDTHCELNILLKFVWYFEKETNQDYYYKLDTMFNPHGFTFTGGIFNISNMKPILKEYGYIV